MTNDDRKRLFQNAYAGALKLQQEYPGYPPFVSIANQLIYLMKLVAGEPVNPANLASINIGLIAAREVETRNEEVADTLHSVSAEVDKLKEEYGLPVEKF